MRNKLEDVNNIAFAFLERLSDESLSDKEMEKVIKVSRIGLKGCEILVKSAAVSLGAAKFKETRSISSINEEIPDILK